MPLKVNPVLLALADGPIMQKSALVPPGAGAPDPNAGAMGAAPPPDPSMGGGAPGAAPGAGDPSAMAGLDPSGMAQAQQMAVAQGAAGGKGGKKLEQQVIDTKLWTIQYIMVMIAQQLGINLPPALLIGPPPDPMAQAMAQQDNQTMQQATGAPAPGGDASGGGAPAPSPDMGKTAGDERLAEHMPTFDGIEYQEKVPSKEEASLSQKAAALKLMASALRRNSK